jgi:hypothetical protein
MIRWSLMVKFLFSLSPSERVCLAFLTVSMARLMATRGVSDLQSFDAGQFPYLEFGFLGLASATVRFSGKLNPNVVFALVALIVSHYGFQKGSYHFLHKARWLLLGFWAWAFRGCVLRAGVNSREILLWVRNLAPLLLMVFMYPLVPLILDPAKNSDLDFELNRIDRWLFSGTNPHLWLERRIPGAWLEWMTLCYSSYGFLFMGVLGALLIRRKENGAAELVFQTCLSLAIGYTLYWVVPAVGPESSNSFDGPLRIEFFSKLKETTMDRTRIARDCFPSLHTAITWIVTVSAAKHMRPVFWVILPFTITVPFACVILRYHYVVDVFAGALLAFVISSTRISRFISSLGN